MDPCRNPAVFEKTSALKLCAEAIDATANEAHPASTPQQNRNRMADLPR
jgi:hypothetical protein